MSQPELSTAAGRLCMACGLCCNGVLFHFVRLQHGDSAPALVALGLRLKRKRGQTYLLQPCPAHRESACSIYSERPERCRLFACQQLRGVAAGEITETQALERIREAQRLVACIEDLLARAGKTNLKHPLTKRCEKAIAEPLDFTADPAARAARDQLTRTMAELETLLDADFRFPPPAA